MSQATDIRALTRSGEVYDQIRSDIMSTRIPPGARLKLAPLCERFGVSLSVVREALTRLSQQHLVRSQPNLGFSVVPLDRAGLLDLTDVRVELETLALRWAVERGDFAWESSVVAALHQLGRTPVSEPGAEDEVSQAWLLAHANFHTALASGCDSPLLMELRRGPYDSAEIYRSWARPAARRKRNVHREHTEIANAAIGRDSERAQRVLEAHIRRTTEVLLTSDLMNAPAADERTTRPVAPSVRTTTARS